MNGQFRAEDLEAVIAEGSLVDLFTALAGKQVTQPEPPDEDDGPKYHIPRKGAWPCGTCPPGTLHHNHEETQ